MRQHTTLPLVARTFYFRQALDGKLPEPTSLEIVTPEVLAPVDSCEEMNPPMKDTKDLSGSSSLEKWLDTAGSALKSGNKGVAIIVALGMIAIPLMMTGSPWVSPILAAGAVLVAILSC